MAMSQRMRRFCFQLRLKSTQLFILAGSVVLSLLVSLLCIGFTIRYEVEHEVANVGDVDYWKDAVSAEQKPWYDKGIEELKRALRGHSKLSQPRNVWLLMIQGIDAPALAAARFNGSQHSGYIWDRFPHAARLKNSCSNSSPCDASAVFRALWTGVPLAAAQRVRSNCSAAPGQLLSVLRQAQLAGLRTGFVTNQRLTGATGAALYAEVAQSSWECDGLMPMGAIESGCQDVAQQLISGATGQALNVLLGGGRQMFNSKVPTFAWDPSDELLCHARAGRNLLRDWRNQKLKSKPMPRFELVQHEQELSSINGSSLDYLLGVLANGDLSANSRAPTLQLMLNRTLQVLRRPGVGHLLIVEHHVQPHMVAREQLQLLNATLARLMGQKDLLTMVLLTNGNYLSSSRDVSGETQLVSTLEESLQGPELQLQRRLQQLPSESLLFAQGPKSLLFYGVHDETYLAQALSYALGIDVFGRQL
ncbi:alkaline phosphatase [Drosophila montana]|uniref:alkaline phosphatase n=1 Tax=Drosophila montana TaxID=40370 RepID=UPI00313D52A6